MSLAGGETSAPLLHFFSAEVFICEVIKMGKLYLNVNGTKKRLKELSYDDLVWLFRDYIEKNQMLPSTDVCNISNNLPHGKRIKEILRDSHVTFNDFINQFGKYDHVRSSIDNYDIYVERYKEKSNDVGHGLTITELKNNRYGLPSAQWLVQNCPDVNVKTFDDFVVWAGFDSNKLKRNKEEIINILKNYEQVVNRPITRSDINKNNIGFSMIVINRIWGSLSNCKKELGLKDTSPSHPKPFLYYKKIIDEFILDIQNRDIHFTTWKEIEGVTTVDHKTFVKSFSDNGVDFYQYLSSYGVNIGSNSYGYSSILHTGEKTTSSYEYTFSTYLSSIGYMYNVDYKRDVMYKMFLPLSKQSKINCDYVFDDKYVEIAGIINNKDNNWESCVYTSKTKRKYQDKMLMKKRLLQENNKQFLFLFPEDFDNDEYKIKFQRLIGKENQLYGTR